MLSSLSHGQLLKLLSKVDSLSDDQSRALLSALGREVNERCAQNGLFWLRFVHTRDESDPERAVKPFPVHLAYVQDLWGILVRDQRIVIAKSRQMLVSWVMACFVTWWARYKGNQAVYWQTKAYEDAVAMICMPSGGFQGRCQFIEDNLPVWMKIPYKPSEGRIQYPNGSIIQGLAGGADKIRSKVASLIVEDEFAYQEDQDGVYTAVAPLIQKGAKAIFVSSPNGAGNMFATLFHGHPVEVAE